MAGFFFNRLPTGKVKLLSIALTLGFNGLAIAVMNWFVHFPPFSETPFISTEILILQTTSKPLSYSA